MSKLPNKSRFIFSFEPKKRRALDNVFFVPQEARWQVISLAAHTPKIGKSYADTFFNDQHPTLKADFIMANPPFNLSDWGADKLEKDARWKFGIPPAGNANFAWMQHMIHHPQENWQKRSKVPQENWQNHPKVPQENWHDIWKFVQKSVSLQR